MAERDEEASLLLGGETTRRYLSEDSFDNLEQNYQEVQQGTELSDGDSTSKPEYVTQEAPSTAYDNFGKAVKVLFVITLICLVSLLLVAGTTSASFRSSVVALLGRVKSYYSQSGGATSSNPTSNTGGGIDYSSLPTDDAYWQNYTASPQTHDFELKRRGYSSLNYWGYAASDVVRYEFLKEYDALIEPHAPMHLTYNGRGSIDDGSGAYYAYSITDSTGAVTTDEATNYYYPVLSRWKKDSTFNVSCKPYEEFSVSISRYSASDQVVYSFTLRAVCIYVRRELRSLTSGDLNATMDAMYAMWTTDDDEGKALYGSDYHSAEWFAQLHDFNAAWSDGDHIHEGLGFLPQHIKMSNLFELSMQAVDPSVSLFYWDFTIESTNDETFYSSPMFADSAFGSLPYSSMHGEGSSKEWSWRYDSVADSYIPNGRWAGIQASANVFDSLASPFGYLRGPWNTNPGQKITRFASNDLMSENIPSCRVYKTWLQEMDWNAFMQTSENAPHASIHGSIGGVYGCDMLDELYDAGYVGQDADGVDYRDDICYKWPFYMKELYRADILSSKTGCTADDALTWHGTACGYVCNSARDDDLSSVLQGLSLSNYVSNASDPLLWEGIGDFICTGNAYRIFSGDHLESASPADPSFWPIHPTQERLYHAKMFAGGFLNYTAVWPSATGAPKLDYDWVCNHAECYNYTDTSADKDKGYFSSCCEGHFEHDQLFDFSTGDRENKFGPTNSQILLDTDPTSRDYVVGYVYDDFTWKHCRDLTDWDVGAEIEVLYENSTTWR